MFSNPIRDLIITAQHTEMTDNFVIEILVDKVEALSNEFRGEYDVMAEHLKIMNKRMVLLNPVSIIETF
jgi:hypothetical protein